MVRLQGPGRGLPASYTTCPKQQQDIQAEYVTGVKIRFRLILNTDDASVAPLVEGLVLESIINFPVKNAYDLTFRLMDNDRTAQRHQRRNRAETDLTTLKSWYGVPAKPLRMFSTFSLLTETAGVKVVIQPPGIRPIPVLNARTQDERSILRMTVLEI